MQFCPTLRDPYYGFKIISHKYRFIYYEIPKCGSSTIKNIIFKNCAGEALSASYKIWIPQAPHLVFPENHDVSEYPDYYKFCFIRNPWDRLVSAWSDKRNHYSFLSEKSFREFLDLIQNHPNHHWAPCTAFIPHKEDIYTVDFIGRMESFSDDFTKLCKKLGLTMDSIPRINASQRKDYRCYYDKRDARYVQTLFASDIDLGNYCF